jgi:hypothetical protein
MSKDEVFYPKSNLKLRALSPTGITAQEAIQKGEKALTALKEEYNIWLLADIKMLEEQITHYSQENAHKINIRKKITTTIHDIRSQGSTFGYPLVTSIAHSFCRLLEETKEDLELPSELFFLHLNSLKLVTEKNIDGDGGDAAKILLKSLDVMVDKYLQNPDSIHI